MAYIHKGKINKEVESFLKTISLDVMAMSRKIWFFDEATIMHCSGWYIPKHDCIILLKHDGHRKFVDDVKLIYEKNKALDNFGLMQCEWIRFNVDPEFASITANEGKHDEVMTLLEKLKPYIKSEMTVEFLGVGATTFKPYDIDTKDDLLKRFWKCRLM